MGPLVVIPIYLPILSPREAARVTISIGNARGEVVFLAPQDLDLSYYLTNFPRVGFVTAPSQHFSSRQSYSQWLTSRSFYNLFAGEEFILICQTDAMLLRHLSIHKSDAVDYVGAPWKNPFTLTWNPVFGTLRHGSECGVRKAVAVGNGGFSLRRVRKFARASVFLPRLNNHINEDLIWSFFGGALGIRIATRNQARKFAIETEASNDRIGEVSGVHALFQHDRELEDKILFDRGFRNIS